MRTRGFPLTLIFHLTVVGRKLLSERDENGTKKAPDVVNDY